jgi:hypothetical protein
MHEEAQSPGLSLLKKFARVALKATRKKEKRVKEQKEKGLLLHPPLRHQPP